MKKVTVLAGALALGAFLWSCNKQQADTPMQREAYLDLPATPAQYYPFQGAEEMNRQATLGRVLFYEQQLSVNNATACASCHKQAFAFADDVAGSRGFENRLTSRNSMPIQDLGFSNIGFGMPTNLFWDGRAMNLEDLVPGPLTNHIEMGLDDVEVLPAKLARLPYYAPLFQSAFGSEEITTPKIAAAIATFLRAISAANSRFDQHQSTGQSVLTALELQGEHLFNTTYDCAGCHTPGQGYMGNSFMDIGLDNTYADPGLQTVTNRAEDRGKFKIPNLHNIALTAPYMHDGRFATLSDVIDHYSRGIRQSPNLDPRLQDDEHRALRLNITEQDKQALIAFLGSLTDHTMVTDPKFSDPFKLR